ncbi:GntR family transcriptional regulator [Rhizobiaceae bacterium n13]|uniref:GntR family transcriptional regulator n=1 Tax=Ferirhizobium litorale TaxID=2927786 RepID=A0AAE3QGR4_9HYPH|nr:GntR family transcriptional regulator [Fererhizobium litorale]MDI7865134.1 GntR family transcriptional regulator [Fererhizobium litorale]MDI7922894.1 GntR family transcriptional regulator [Fererhizobium litorale]
MDGNLREQVLQHVRSEIISGQSAPGAMYSVPSLAATMGVSTTPVREALLELARNGLIEPLRNRGFKVVAPTLTELRNLFDMRELLEVYAAETVALKRKKDLSGLRLLADAVAHAVENGNVSDYLEADRRFHRAFTEQTDNELLTETVMAMRDKMRLYGIGTSTGRDRQRESVAEHYRIIDLAEIGDANGLRDLMRHHIRSWEPIFTEALLQANQDLPRSPRLLR